MTTGKAKRGVYAAAITPLADDGGADLPKLARYCAWLLAEGLDGVAPTGTTGEGTSVALTARLRLPGALAAEGIPGDRAIIGTGCPSADDAVALTRACVEAGFPNVLVLPPYYFKGPGEDGLYAYYARLIDAVGSDALRVYLYHFPAMSAVPIPIAVIRRLKAAYGPIIAGLKDSSGDYEGTRAFADAVENFDVFPSNEGVLRDALARGMGGVISATTNVAPRLARRTIDARGAEAEMLQALLGEVRRIVAQYPLQSAIKEIEARRSGDDTWRRLFPPLTPLPAERADNLLAELRDLPAECGVFGDPAPA